ncbi:DUF4168 domain-containing protein [Aquisalimonas sp.]|uniref:DUF4168 domain-containing protein n=1 Tax=unclassified Aquisalimonas TaxID=2644645 RepID=UPI0025BF6824|nr:DUF4168 domain-containing protein [Aquisalimonas sp.]
MKKRNSIRFMIPLMSGLLLMPAMSALAMDGDDAQAETYEQEPDGMAEQQDFDDETLERFADAYVEVGEIHREYSERLQGAEQTEDAQQLQQEANDEMVEAIQESGLEVQEYSAVAAALERDPEMREEVVGMIEDRQ